jgi:hypothetical protein
MYRDVDEVESFRAEAPVPTGRLRALLGYLGITTTLGTRSRKSHIQDGWSSRPSQRSFSGPGSSTGTRGQLSERLTSMLWLTPPGRPLPHGSVATRADYRTPSTTPTLSEEGPVQGLRGEEGCPRMEMVHHQDVMVELSTRLLAAWREIETLRI